MSKANRFTLRRNPLEQMTVPSPVALVKPQEEILNLDRINLEDRGNWLRALEMCKPQQNYSLPELLNQIATYQGQIDKAIQTAEAQSTIYAYAIGTRLDFIEQEELFKDRGYRNLTDFINGGEIHRPNGTSITPRQVWAYRRVTRGLNDFLELVERIRGGENIPEDVQQQVQAIGQHLRQDVIQQFLTSYVDGITSVLELGVSKLEQVCRLPKPVALSGLLTGQLTVAEAFLPVHELSFSQLRKAISQHGKTASPQPPNAQVDKKLGQLERLVQEISAMSLTSEDWERVQNALAVLSERVSAEPRKTAARKR
ncbi:hypothetical protein [Leptolyngbya ohadii]|uniref:hypothetical protein n=1 Tax=Leptolyngbya ohadii TaxID=1962290 RepID=UPI001CEC14B5|nr:hypothetical protein [Leptolyngbya ohadii]